MSSRANGAASGLWIDSRLSKDGELSLFWRGEEELAICLRWLVAVIERVERIEDAIVWRCWHGAQILEDHWYLEVEEANRDRFLVQAMDCLYGFEGRAIIAYGERDLGYSFSISELDGVIVLALRRSRTQSFLEASARVVAEIERDGMGSGSRYVKFFGDLANSDGR